MPNETPTHAMGNAELVCARVEQLVETLHDITHQPRAEIWDSIYQLSSTKRSSHFLEDLLTEQRR